MSDYAKSTGAARSVTLLGKEYAVSKLRPRDIGTIEAWFKDVTPNPKKEARQHMEGLPDAVAMHIWDEALKEAKDWPPGFDSDAGQKLLLTDEGQARILHICLKRGFADGQFTLEQARDLAEQLDADAIFEVLKLASPGDPDDPLVRSPATMTTTNGTADHPVGV